MQSTLCQRLDAGTKIGFEYAYMGFAEYEFGATRAARKALNNADALKRVKFKVKTPDKLFDCIAIFDEEGSQRAVDLMKALQSGDYRNKGGMAYPSRDPLGWLVLYPVPMLIHMDSDDGAVRAKAFLEHAEALFAKGS